MFTIRFIKHGGTGTRNFSASDYETDVGENCIDVAMTLEDGSTYHEQVGPTQPYDVAYVTNATGKTIDKITL